MKKIIVTGGSGFFGINWFCKTSNKYINYLVKNKTSFKINKKNTVTVDLSKKIKIEKIIKDIKPDFIIHAAAKTNLDISKKKSIIEKKIQFKITKNIVDICKKKKIPLIFISSDQLYDGKNKSKYLEKDSLNPINWYAESKRECENLIKKLKKSTIIRTNFFGWAPVVRKSFSDFIIFNSQNKKISLYDNIFYTPIVINQLVNIISIIIDKEIYGVFNVTSREKISKFDFGLKVKKIFKLRHKILKTKYVNIESKTQRPLNMSLSNRKIEKRLALKIPSLNSQIKELYKEYKNLKYKKIRYKFI
jgi:dTDP-4-dehydrorhamnose reductase